MANNNSDSEEIEAVEIEQDLAKELGFDIAVIVFSPGGRTFEIDFHKENDNASTSNGGGDATTDSGKPVNNNIKFVLDGVAVHHVKTDPSMEIPGNELDDKKKAAIKAKAEKSKAIKEAQDKDIAERE